MFWTSNIPNFDIKVSTKSHFGIFRTGEACKPLMKCMFWPVQNILDQPSRANWVGIIVLARDPPISHFGLVFCEFGQVWASRQSLKCSLVDGNSQKVPKIPHFSARSWLNRFHRLHKLYSDRSRQPRGGVVSRSWKIPKKKLVLCRLRFNCGRKQQIVLITLTVGTITKLYPQV